MLKTLLVLCGALVVSATSLHAQGARSPMAARSSSFAGRSPGFAARPAAYHGGSRYGGGSYYGHHHGNYGRYYYLGGVPYFYPFAFGFGYPYYYGSYYGGFGDAYGYGYGPSAYDGAAYNGRIAEGDNGGQQPPVGGSLPEAVQRQLSKRGYYKGSIDGQFGPASRDALSRFQRKQGIKETGRIDEPTLEALGFTDQH